MARPRGSTAAKVLLREAAKKSLVECAKSALAGDAEAQKIMVSICGRETLSEIANR